MMEGVIARLLTRFEEGKLSRRQFVQSVALAATVARAFEAAPAVAADSGLIKAVGVNHISIQTPDYAKSRDLYVNLLGARILADDGKSCSLKVGETVLIFRYPSVRRPAFSGSEKVDHGSSAPGVDHISYTVANWETDPRVEEAVRTELTRRGLPTGQDQEPGKSRTFHINDPIGLGLQMGGKDQV
jgi:catechol 2,3-dioxygenase-like lactoylglutathione lyase family enzyme